jgi:hypothetical protein
VESRNQEMGSGLVFCFLILDSIFSNNILQVGLMNQAPTLFFSGSKKQDLTP